MDLKEAFDQKGRWDGVFERAVNDKSFREEFVKNPIQVLETNGIKLPGVEEVIVHEYDEKRAVLILPTFGSDLAKLTPELSHGQPPSGELAKGQAASG